MKDTCYRIFACPPHLLNVDEINFNIIKQRRPNAGNLYKILRSGNFQKIIKIILENQTKFFEINGNLFKCLKITRKLF